MGLSIEILIGKDSNDYIEKISQLRIEAFKEYPYLYQGELAYEKQYVRGYTTDSKAMIAIAKLDGTIAGISSGIPLISESEIVSDAKKIFSAQKINISDYYYYGEIIILPEFRSQGNASKLYSAQDELIKSWGFKYACILTVVREEDHPLKPKDYKSPDKMWEHFGFFRNNLTTKHHWPTIQSDMSVVDIDNILEFWTKKL